LGGQEKKTEISIIKKQWVKGVGDAAIEEREKKFTLWVLEEGRGEDSWNI